MTKKVKARENKKVQENTEQINDENKDLRDLVKAELIDPKKEIYKNLEAEEKEIMLAELTKQKQTTKTNQKAHTSIYNDTGLVEVDKEWLSWIFFQGAGEKYKSISSNDLKYIINYLKLGTIEGAYRASWSCDGMSETAVMTAARGVHGRKDIQGLIAILRERMILNVEKRLSWQFEDSVDNLKFLIDTAKEEIQNCREDGKRSYLTLTRVTAIKDAVKELNQMMGYTEKTVKINNSVTIVGNEADLKD